MSCAQIRRRIIHSIRIDVREVSREDKEKETKKKRETKLERKRNRQGRNRRPHHACCRQSGAYQKALALLVLTLTVHAAHRQGTEERKDEEDDARLLQRKGAAKQAPTHGSAGGATHMGKVVTIRRQPRTGGKGLTHNAIKATGARAHE